jgi:hypothetical protein
MERLIEPHRRLRYFCAPQHVDSPLRPVIDQMERAAGLVHDDTLLRKLDKLDAALAQTSTSIEDAALFAEMLSLPSDRRYPALDVTPDQRRHRTLEALISRTEVLARETPVLMILEDAQWIDPTSLEVFGRTVVRIKARQVLLIITFRPEFNAPWVGQSHVTSLTLNRLGEREAVAIIADIVGDEELPADVMAEIVEHTDGIPLFVEEMTKAVLEAKSAGDARQTAVAVPASLQASLMARLDRLGPAKEVAQIGAAIGRQFSHALLAALVRKPEVELLSALDRLVAASLLFREGTSPYATYFFKHALVQDAAYGTLLREPKRALHARIAEALETQFAEIAESQPELLARHCIEAGLTEKAAALWGKAGQRSLERSALVEAMEQLSRALAQITHLPATPVLRREQINLQVALITPLSHVKGTAASETKAAAARARVLIEQAEALGEPPEDSLLLLSALCGQWAANMLEFDGNVVRNLAAEMMALAEKQGLTTPLMVAHRVVGLTLLYTGDIAQGKPHFDRTIELYDPIEHRPLAARFLADARSSCLCNRSLALWLLGYSEAALADARYALKDAREIGQAATLMFALHRTSLNYMLSGDYATASERASELEILANEKGAAQWKAEAMLAQGMLVALTGKVSNAVESMTFAIGRLQSIGARPRMPHYLSLGKAYAELIPILHQSELTIYGKQVMERTSLGFRSM